MNKIKVLIAEDIEINRYLVKVQLKKYSFDIDFVFNGQEVLEKLKTHVYDIILMDLQMPVMDGYETAKYIRTKLQAPVCNIPILAVSAYADKFVLENCVECGINDYISKPYSADDLYNKILDLLTESQSGGSILHSAPKKEIVEVEYDHYYINLSFLEEVSEGNHEFVKQMVEYFITNTPSFLVEFRKSTENTDWNMIKQHAHKFSTQLSYMGISAIIKDVEIIEKCAREEKNINLIQILAVKVENVCNEAIKELQGVLAKMNQNDG
jgi:CheY-like chemotaxis protein/HPt (histidine-containing phosphotransfer) domain-containing protein